MMASNPLTVLKSGALRQLARAAGYASPFAITRPSPPAFQRLPPTTLRSFVTSPILRLPSATELDAASMSGKPGESGDHEGQLARTDINVRVEYPEEKDMPRSSPLQGRGGVHAKRTLASFSLQGRVGVVTGGARGLGLVMTQALIISGADAAIVDMNSQIRSPIMPVWLLADWSIKRGGS